MDVSVARSAAAEQVGQPVRILSASTATVVHLLTLPGAPNRSDRFTAATSSIPYGLPRRLIPSVPLDPPIRHRPDG